MPSPSPSPSPSLPPSNKKRAVVFSLGCGCKDSKSVSVSTPTSLSPSTDPTTTPPHHRRHPLKPPESSSFDTPTLTSTSSSSSQLDHHGDADDNNNQDSPSFSGLLRQLSQLEQSVMEWESRREVLPERDSDSIFPGRDGSLFGDGGSGRKGHRRSKSEGGGALRKVGESVAVVKESADPLGDFRRSMLQMIVEKEIVDGEELRELLARFLALNSPCHHGLIVRAFSDIWNDVFSGYETTPNLLKA